MVLSRTHPCCSPPPRLSWLAMRSKEAISRPRFAAAAMPIPKAAARWAGITFGLTASRSFPGPDSYFDEEEAVVKIQGDKVARIISLRDNSERTQYQLEPELITNLFDRSREKRRMVHFDDLPRTWLMQLFRPKISDSFSIPVSIRSGSSKLLTWTFESSAERRVRRRSACSWHAISGSHPKDSQTEDRGNIHHSLPGTQAFEREDLRVLCEPGRPWPARVVRNSRFRRSGPAVFRKRRSRSDPCRNAQRSPV